MPGKRVAPHRVCMMSAARSRANGVTVVIPTRDRAELLELALRSIREQSVAVSQVIVCDDGSRDNTPSVVERHGAVLIRNSGEPWGAGTARNVGLAAVSTDLVAFLDSDDLLHPNAYELLGAALDRLPESPFAHGNGLRAMRRTDGWQVTGLIAAEPAELERPLCSLFARNRIPSSGALVRTRSAREIGGYDERLVYSEDHDFWLRLALGGDPAYVPSIVCLTRQHFGNRHGSRLAAKDIAQISRLADDRPILRRCLARRAGVELLELMGDAFAARDYATASRALCRGLGHGRSAPQVFAAAAWHWRARKRFRRRGIEVFESSSELGGWLAHY